MHDPTERCVSSLVALVAALAMACSSPSSDASSAGALAADAPTPPGDGASSEDEAGDAEATLDSPSMEGSTDAIALEGEPYDGVDPSPSEPPVDDERAVDADLLEALRAYLAVPRDERPVLGEQPFARVAIGAATSREAERLLWDDHVAFVEQTRTAEHAARAITLGDFTLRYDYVVFGDAPEGGHSLYLSLHGGGEADASVNDQQWENQKLLYQPEEGIYLAPRAPTNTWNLWHQEHVDALFDRLIENFVVLEGVAPDRVYVMGYSAGGDGVYQLAPRMADRWAAAAMMAGHPNDAEPDSLRNLGFTLHVGGLDTAFDRNLVGAQWGELLDDLAAGDPGGYPHEVQVHADKPHWMDLEDAVAVPWMAAFTRNPAPERIVWLQDDVTHERFYWLSVPPDEARAGARLTADLDGQAIRLDSDGVERLNLRLSDAMLDLDQPVTVSSSGSVLFEGIVDRTIETLAVTIAERGDPSSVFSAQIGVQLP